MNEGREAGSSLPHSHSQLTWLPAAPPAVVAEPGLPAGETILERDGLTLTCPSASRLPYEFQLAPSAPEANAFTSPLLASALLLLAEAVRALRRLEGPVPLNVWLHDGAHWHLEVLPRITILAGLELGAGVFVNALPPEEAAGRLSGALANDEDRLADDPPDDSAATAGV